MHSNLSLRITDVLHEKESYILQMQLHLITLTILLAKRPT